MQQPKKMPSFWFIMIRFKVYEMFIFQNKKNVTLNIWSEKIQK